MKSYFERIRENNELIGNFMGFVNSTPELPLINFLMENKETGKSFTIKGCKYHESWDWLMPTIEKICEEGYRYYFKINEESAIARFTDMAIPGNQIIEEQLFDYDKPIRVSYLAVVNFIKYYNKLNTN